MTDLGCKVLFIGEDVDIWRLIELILSRDRNDTVSRACSTDEIYAVAKEVFDLVIVDHTASIIDNGNGITIYRYLQKVPTFQGIPVLLWRVPVSRQVYTIAQELRIAGCIELVSTPEELIAARDIVLQGGSYYPPLR